MRRMVGVFFGLSSRLFATFANEFTNMIGILRKLRGITSATLIPFSVLTR